MEPVNQDKPTLIHNDFNGQQYRVVKTSEGNMYYLSDIAEILGMVKARTSVGGFDDTERLSPAKKKQLGIVTYKQYKNTNRRDDTIVMLTHKGLKRLVCSSRSLHATAFAGHLGFDIHMRRDHIEMHTLGRIVKAFRMYKYCTQYTVMYEDMHGKDVYYRVDLYFPDLKLAVECDEKGHKMNNPADELERQKFIEIELGCTFIRYNPDAPDFDVCDQIARIHEFIVRK